MWKCLVEQGRSTGKTGKGELWDLRSNVVNVYDAYLYTNIHMNTLPYVRNVNNNISRN